MTKNNAISVVMLKEYMQRHYGHITIEQSDEELQQFLDQPYIAQMGGSLLKVADTLADYLLARGAEAIE